MRRPERTEETAVLLKRLDVLDRLCRDPAHIRDLVDETGHSRRTINRAVTELEAENFVERGSDGIEVTTAGRLARQRLDRFLSELDDVLVAETVLDALPADANIDPSVVAGGEALLASEPASFRPLERMHEELIAADRYRALVPTLEDARHVRLLYEHVVSQGNPAELVVTPDVFNTLREEFPRRMAVLAEAEGFSLFVGQTPPFAIGLFDHSGSDERCRVHLLVLTGSGGVHGSIVNDTDAALDWAERRYDEYRAAATERTDEVVVDTDGGVQPVQIRSGPTLPASVERQGFVALDVEYFGDEPVADPQTAWRTGFSLAEVHTGYSIERPSADDERTSVDGDGLSSDLESAVLAGTNCLLVGLPGSGKSTVCKQVACRWYENDRGPVFYREHDRGRPFSAVESLVETAVETDGHALVVVEDAVRRDANAIFEVLDRLGERDDVSFLLDARESEWRAYSEADVTTLDVHHIPPMEQTDCERIVTHFEQTVGRTVDVSTETLWLAARDESATGEQIHEMLRLTHRLSNYTTPLTDRPTALEDAVATAYEELAADDLMLSVGLLANVLNAADVDLERALLYAVADPDEFDAVDDAIGWLEGRVLFPREDGSDRTVHEEWSIAFLSHAADDCSKTRRRFRTALTALLGLADRPDQRVQIQHHLENGDSLEQIRDDPQRWVDTTVHALYDLCRRRSTLTLLFDDGTVDGIVLPEATSNRITEKRPLWLGEAFLTGGYYDRAECAFERLSQASSTNQQDRLLGLGQVAFKRGAYDEAVTYHQQGLSLAREHGDLEGEAHHLKGLGLATWRLGSYEAAREYFEQCLDRARQLDDRELAARAEANLGTVAWSRGLYDRARDHFETFLHTAREIGDRHGEATSLNNLGSVAYHQWAYDRARERFEESLAIRREIGYRSGEASCLNYLGLTASKQGALGEATEYHETALDIATEIAHARERGHAFWGLGIVAKKRGEYETAARDFEKAVAVFDETGNQSYLARATLEQAHLALETGRVAAAREQTEQLLQVAESRGELYELGRCRKLLSQVAATEGRRRDAREHARAALERFEDCGLAGHALDVLEYLVEACQDEGDAAEANRWYQRATELASEAPDRTAELHQEWLDEYAEHAERA